MLLVMSGAWIVMASLMLGPPSPQISGPVEGPAVEGPAVEDPAVEDEDAEPPGIEFAPAPRLEPDASLLEPGATIEVPPPPEGVQEGPLALSSTDEASLWPDPGNAPSDGSAALVSAGVLIPVGVLVPLGLLQDPRLSGPDRSGIIVAGVGMEIIGVAILGIGLHRRVKLARWAGAYRVQPTPQGGGLLAFGGIALTAGVTLDLLGLWVMGRGGAMPQANAMVIGGSAALALAPLGLVFGKRRANNYAATGGWVRRPMPMPPVTVVPRLLVLQRGAGISFAGRF
jgi:hypothetical protein